MSGTLTVGGGYNPSTGFLPVPSNFTSSINTALQSYINSLSTSVSGGALGSTNIVSAGSTITTSTVTGSSGSQVQVISNTLADGSTVAGAASGSYAVDPNTVALTVQAPGAVTVTGASATQAAILGANSNVTYSVTNGQGSILAAGGANSINVYSAGAQSNIAVYSAGNDTINLSGVGADTVTADGTAMTSLFVGAGTATVNATAQSKTSVVFTQNAGGNVNFINSSTQAATVYSGSYTVKGGANVFAPNSVTAFGGAGGGIFVGGRAGSNVLTEGTGLATLIGGGTGDVLTAAASVTGAINELYTGQGTETLLGTATSGKNAFNIGLLDVGVGDVTASGVASTAGAGTQSFLIGNTLGETLTGSQASSAFNIYDIVGTATTGGSTMTITDFNPSNSIIFLTDATGQAASDASVTAIGTQLGHLGNAQIALSDGTSIILQGVSASSLTTTTFSSGVVGIG
ncbi:MAG: hypothetical protein POH28_10935 [Acidocella sp.]|nr:hypothetical protein [Acidocella sp.]